MPHFLLTGTYTPAALQALARNPSDRHAAARKLVETAGGKLVSFYRTVGNGPGVHIVIDADPITALAISVVVTAGGALTDIKFDRLWSDEEVAQMRAKRAQIDSAYQAPA
jgi:uncharacterized protein with GYD domain